MMKVLFWPGCWYPDAANPANGIFTRRHAETVAGLVDLAVLFVTTDNALAGEKFRMVVGREKTGLTIRVYYRPVSLPFRFTRVVNAWRYYKAARMGLRRLNVEWGRPQVIHLHVNPPWGQILAMRHKLGNCPFLFTEHWTGYQPESGKYTGFLRKLLTSWVVRHAAAVTPVSENLRGVMEGHGLRGRYTVIPNAVDTDLFTPGDGGADRPRVFLHVSRLAPVKNVPGILRATAELWRKRRDFRLIVAGHGEERFGLEKMAGELGILGECVQFVGQQNEYELAVLMRRVDCFILFSHYENLPCVISEAMACGLPVIATRVCGVPEQVGPETGILIEPGDESALTEAMDEVLGNKRSFAAELIRKTALEKYGFAAIGQRYVQLYRQALRGYGPGGGE